MMTTAVPLTSCCCLGHSTFFSSAQDSWRKRMPGVPEPDLVAALGAWLGRLPRRLLLGGRARPGRGPERRRAGGLRAALAALLTGRAGHLAYRVSRCSVWPPHQRQYFLNSTRSGEFRFDFCVW